MKFRCPFMIAIVFLLGAPTAQAASFDWGAKLYEPQKKLSFEFQNMGHDFRLDGPKAHIFDDLPQMKLSEAPSVLLASFAQARTPPVLPLTDTLLKKFQDRPAYQVALERDDALHDVPAPNTLSLMFASLMTMAIFARLKRKSSIQA